MTEFVSLLILFILRERRKVFFFFKSDLMHPSELIEIVNGKDRKVLSVVVADMHGTILQRCGQVAYLKQGIPSLFSTEPPSIGELWKRAIADGNEQMSLFWAMSGDMRHELHLCRIADSWAVIETPATSADTERLLKESEQRLQLVVQQTGQMVYDYDLRTGTITWAGATSEITGYCAEELAAMNIKEWAEHIHPEDREEALSLLDQARKSRGRYSVDYRFRRKNNSYIHIRDNGAFLLDEEQIPFRMIGSMADITEQKIAEDIIRHQAHHDGLTGLPNRTLVLDRIDLALAHARRVDEGFAVLFLDLDRFKPINDTLGHGVGDGLLIAVAQRLVGSLRPDDTVSRNGGDEFIVLLPGIPDAPSAGIVAEKILHELGKPFFIDGFELHISASIGIAVFPSDGKNAEEIIRNADVALYRSKEAGRDRYAFYSDTRGSFGRERITLQQELKAAIPDDQLRLVFLPTISLTSSAVSSYEALLRWQHPRLGLLLPEAFLPIAEETGLMLAIGDWVIDEGLANLKRWSLRGDPSLLRLNISAQQFFQPQFVRRLADRVIAFDLPAQKVRLEIHEGIALQRGGHTEQILRELDAMGFSLSIDNFGTGYGALRSLQDYPIREVKIDRSLIRDMGERRSQWLIQGMVQMARALGLSTVAGGVEHEGQKTLLRQYGCDEAQGWLFGTALQPIGRNPAQ